MTDVQSEFVALRNSAAQWVDKDAVILADLLASFYRSTPPAARHELNLVITQWLHSEDPADRYEELALVRRLRDVRFKDDLRALIERLEGSTRPEAPYEVAAVRRVLETLRPG